ncbi:MAG: helix-turn-helix domain-containing protein [Thermoprotei archaeon]
MTDPNPTVRHLRALGLSKSEAELYYACLTAGATDAKTLSTTSGVPYGKVYSSLKKLIDKGWIVEAEGYPKKFSARSPRDAVKNYRNYVESQLAAAEKSAIEELEPLFQAKDSTERPQVWMISGFDKIVSKAESMILDCEREIEVALPTLFPGLVEAASVLKNKIESVPIRIRILASKDVGEVIARIRPSDAEFRVVDRMFGGGIVADKSEALILLGPDKSPTAIWAKHSALAEIALTYFDYVWNAALPLQSSQP